jgi:hypothetical protein
MTVPNQQRLKLKEVRSRLPPEGQKWLQGMTRGELEGTEIVLNNVGEQSFLENWQFHQQHLQELRDFFWPIRA